MDRYYINFDGSCWPKNPGGFARYGAVIFKNGNRIHTIQGVMEETETSNNVGEYGGLIMALTYLLSIEAQNNEVVVIGDSKLVISQMFRGWRIKNGFYVKYAKYCKELVNKFQKIKGKLVPREMNEEADNLASFYSTDRVKVPFIDNSLFGSIKENHISEDEVASLMAIAPYK